MLCDLFENFRQSCIGVSGFSLACATYPAPVSVLCRVNTGASPFFADPYIIDGDLHYSDRAELWRSLLDPSWLLAAPRIAFRISSIFFWSCLKFIPYQDQFILCPRSHDNITGPLLHFQIFIDHRHYSSDLSQCSLTNKKRFLPIIDAIHWDYQAPFESFRLICLLGQALFSICLITCKIYNLESRLFMCCLFSCPIYILFSIACWPCRCSVKKFFQFYWYPSTFTPPLEWT